MDEEDEHLLSEIECHTINNLLTELARAVLGNIGPRSWPIFTKDKRAQRLNGLFLLGPWSIDRFHLK